MEAADAGSYEVIMDGELQRQCQTRDTAVETARELSQETRGEVKVLSGGRWERLRFKRGQLQSSTYVTPERRHRVDRLS
jgi:hypothetical protein